MNIKKPLILLVGLVLISTTLVGSVSGINLPAGTVTLNVVDGTNSYFNSTLSGVPGGNDVTNKMYPGWCCEFGPHMTRSTNILVTLYNSYGSLPARAQDDDWDKVNWILNNKDGHGYSMMDIQAAIWYLISEETYHTALSVNSQYLVDHAVDGFTYKAGDIIAIVAVPQIGNQTSFIELRIPSIPHTGGRWTGGGTIDTHTPRVTHGFELHCNVSQLPNNLEVNWGGHHFHLDVLENVTVCWNDPAIDPEHPRAGCDTIEGWGHGKLDGVSECHVYFKFTDDGEPGSHDFARIKITDQSDAFVMEVSGNLKSGNQQAHRLTGIDAR